MANIKKLNAIAFEEYVENDGGPCLVVFSRKTCHVCQMVHPKLEVLSEDYPNLPFYEVDVEATPKLLKQYRLKGVPQTLFFKGGMMKDRIAGDADEDIFAEKIEAILK